MNLNQATKCLLCVIFCLYCSFSVAVGKAEYAQGYDPARNPFDDLSMAMSTAKKDNKHILIIAGGEWCSWCHILESYLKKERSIYSELMATFEVMKLNVSKENENDKFLSTLPEIDGYPHFFILSSSGKVVLSKNTAPLEKEQSYDNDKFRILINHFKNKGKVIGDI